jgi:hypothetical protein
LKTTRKTFWLIILTASLCLVFAACGGGGGGGTPDGIGGIGGGGTSDFTMDYTDKDPAILASLDFFYDWYVENADRSLRGPYDSGGTGIVDLGQDARTEATVTLDMVGGFFFTYMSMPVGDNPYNTDDRLGGSTVQVNLTSAVPGDEAHIAYFIDNFFPITGASQTLAQSVTLYNILGTDGLANVFVNYRTSSAAEPLTRYDFRVDFPSADVGNVSMDLGTFRTRVAKDWTSTSDLTTDEPFVMAQRKGAMVSPVGNSTVDLGGLSGTFGFPDQFPADRWYLASGGLADRPEVVAEFSASDTTVSLVPLGRVINDVTMAFDQVQETFTVDITGTDRIDYALLILADTVTFTTWQLVFPWSAVQMSGDTATLALPALPGHPALPAFDFMELTIYRLDGTTTVDSMLRHILDGKRNPFPSFAMKKDWQ